MKLGSYELLREQGGVGAGVLWLARAHDDAAEAPKPFSVVRVHKHLVKKPEMAEAFVADTRPVVGLRHANVAPLAEVGSENGELFAVSEIVEGETLSNLVTAAGAEGLPQPVVLRIALDVLEGLAAAHEHDPAIFHGELGPHQVLVGTDGVAKITGFGLARALSRLAPPVGVKNQERLAYAAPERVKSLATPGAGAAPPAAPAPDAAGDLFSAAVLLWEGVARQRLFGSKIETAIVQKVLSGPIAALATLPNVTAAADLDAAVQQALTRDAAKRTRSAALLIMAIEGLGGDKIAPATEVAALVEKLAGKAIAARRADLAKPTPKLVAPAAAPLKAPDPAARKATLLGVPIPKPVVKAAEAKTDAPATPPAPAARPVVRPGPSPVKVEPAKVEPAKVEPAKAEPAKAEPAKADVAAPEAAKAEPAVKAPIRVDEGLEDDDGPVAASPPKGDAAPPPPSAKPRAPAPPAKKTLLLGTPGTKPSDGPASGPRSAPAPISKPAEAPKAPAAPRVTPPLRPAAAGGPAPLAAAEAPKPAAEAPKAAPEPPKSNPKAAPAPTLIESPSKTSHTPSSDERSSPGSRGTGVEKLGPGRTLGRYEILMPVARGGMASVWAARLPGSRGFQKIFAIKTMLPDVSDDPDFENMFLDEGRIAARIRHPNVVEIIDLGEQDEVLYLVMEWVEGENLGTLVKGARTVGGVPVPIIIRIASQIAAGLHAAHELRDDDGNLLDLVHRDISPANVLVSTSGYVKIVDFGIAKSKGRLHQTRVGGMVKGKTPYLSPEQLGQLPIDRRSDIFSFGVLLYVLTTGLHPFRGESDTKTIENIALREALPLRNIVPTCPPEFEAVVLKALAKDPKDRYATAAEMQRALDQAAAMIGAPTTEEDVAAFVKQAIGETVGKRAQDLRASIERADGRSSSASIDGSGEPVTSTVTPSPRLTPALRPAEAAPEPAGAAGTTGAKAEAPTLTDAREAKPDVATAAEVDQNVAVDLDEGGDAGEAAAQAPAEPPAPRPHHAMPPPPGSDPVAAFAATANAAEADAFGAFDAPGAAAPWASPEPEAPGLAAATGTPGPRAPVVSDAGEAGAGPAPRRKPVALIAVGAVLGVCALIGGFAVLGGGKTPPAKAAATATSVAAAAPTPTPTPAPTPTETAAPAPPPAETAAPAETSAPAVAAPRPTPGRPAGPAPKPNPVRPGGKAKPPSSGKYDPKGI